MLRRLGRPSVYEGISKFLLNLETLEAVDQLTRPLLLNRPANVPGESAFRYFSTWADWYDGWANCFSRLVRLLRELMCRTHEVAEASAREEDSSFRNINSTTDSGDATKLFSTSSQGRPTSPTMDMMRGRQE